MVVVAVVQLSASVVIYRPGTLSLLHVSGVAGDILFDFPSLAAIIANAAILVASPAFRSYRSAVRLLMILGCACVITFLVFSLILIVVLNRWGS